MRGPLPFLDEMRICTAFYTGANAGASLLIVVSYHGLINSGQHRLIGQ